MGGRVAIDMVGVTTGKLTVIKKLPSKQRQAIFECLCECGVTFEASGGGIRGGRIVSCGCHQKSLLLKHGMYKTNTYSSWRHMKCRCDNPKYQQYYDYGGRGIKYDTKWGEFENFYADMGDCPEGFTLERIDVTAGYNKENCKWDTRANQSYNQRISKNNTSGVTGVYQTKNGTKWYAEITKDRRKISLGTFSTKEQAISARLAAELLHFGRLKHAKNNI